jgi:uncharacterized Fe-S cluster protein YjdI
VPATRTYQNKDIIVHWYPELCIHPRYCASILPEVFQPESRPWVNVDGATPREIILAIDRCPSGALRYSLPEGSAVHPAAADGPGRQREDEAAEPQQSPACVDDRSSVKITVTPNGPLLTEGAVKLVDAEGKVLAEANRLSLCRCGLSANPPFCDGSHGRHGWKPDAQ